MTILSYSGRGGRGRGRGGRGRGRGRGIAGRGRGGTFGRGRGGTASTKWVRTKKEETVEGVNSNHNDEGGNQEPIKETQPTQKKETILDNQGPLKKIGTNKLITGAVYTGGNTRRTKRRTNTFDTRYPKRSRRSHPSTTRPASAAKRIALTVKSDLDDTVEGTEDTNEKAHEIATEKLTDFAYRETSQVVQRRHNKKWTSAPGASWSSTKPIKRNMGLVRVQPDQKKTPICPTFLRGVECTDKYCRKRHDVPKEFAMPVCSFFQRQGQCLKGDDCIFRHVKVNPRAIVCPSFALLGFCEDKDCAFKHVRENPSRSKK